MSNTIYLEKINHVFFRVSGELSILQELSEYFTFSVPSAKFNPKYKKRIWDGKIHLFNTLNKTIYCGLIEQIKTFAKNRMYEICIVNNIKDTIENNYNLNQFIKELNSPFEIRDYQYNCFEYGVKNHRALFLSPTSSGKSFIIYLLVQFYLKNYNNKILIIVPTLNLIFQMKNDFIQYAKNFNNIENEIHTIYSGQEKNTNKLLTISTWQSLYKMPNTFFENYKFVLIDEAHKCQAKSLKHILELCTNADWRFGTTGTLDNSASLCNSMIIEGLTGPIYRTVTTKKLMDEKKLAQLSIKCLIFNYSLEECKYIKKFSYEDEIQYLINHKKRNKYIRNLAIAQIKNTLVLFRYVKSHGEILYNIIKEKLELLNQSNRKVFFIHGKTEISDREELRSIIETESNAIIVASAGIFSTGINIKNLDVIIFAMPIKSQIQVLQSIGRVLRIGKSDTATLYDIADNLKYKKHNNHTINQFFERIKIYNNEEFLYNIYSINI